jgi:tight adherence protein C
VLAAKVIGSVVGVALGVVIGALSGKTFTAILLAAAFGALFFVIPDRVIAGRGKSRKERIDADLPDALDLLAICIEAGMSLDAALGQLVDHMTGPLADEFAQTLAEIRIGESRPDALRRLAERCNLPAMTTFARAIIQSDQLGLPLGRALRIQARDARVHREQTAEERAAKMPVKMIVPTAIFIFPVIFFVVVGPAMIDLFKTI